MNSTTSLNRAAFADTPAIASGRVMLSSALSVGTRLKLWKMKPTRRRRSSVRLGVLERAELGVADEHLAGCQGVEAGEAVQQAWTCRSPMGP